MPDDFNYDVNETMIDRAADEAAYRAEVDSDLACFAHGDDADLYE